MKSAHQTLLDVEPVSKGISEKEYIVAYSNVILCEARKKKKERKKKTFGLLSDHEIWHLSHIEPTSRGNQVLWAWS